MPAWSTLDGKILASIEMPLPDGTGPVEPIIEAIAECVADALAKARADRRSASASRVGGMVDTDRGSIVTVNLAPALDGYPLADELGRRFGLPVRLDHHPRALLVGDRWFGEGRGVPQFAVVYTGEVLGGALYFDGHLYRGAAGAGGELGHTFVQVDGELCRCGRRGCWDTIATLGWLRREARNAGLPERRAIDSGRLVALVASKACRAQRRCSTAMPATSLSASPICSRRWRPTSTSCTAMWCSAASA